DASATADVTVREEDVTQDFDQSVYEQQVGDIVEITVQLADIDEAYIFIGGDAAGFIAAAHVEDGDDDGEVTVAFNSYLAGQSAGHLGSVFSQVGDDTVVSTFNRSQLNASNSFSNFDSDYDAETGLGEPVEAGDYDLRVASSTDMASDGTVTDENDVATLILSDRSTDSATVWTAPQGTSNIDLDELQEAVTQDSSIVIGDRVVVQVQASGIYGYFDSIGTEDQILEALADGSPEPVTLELKQTNPGANRKASVVNLSSGTNADLVLDEENNQFFLVVDTRTVNSTRRNLAAGQNWRATFTVGSTNTSVEYGNYVVDDDTESVSGDFSLEDPVGAFNNLNADGRVQVLQSSSAQVSGTTNLAPGSTVNVRLRASGDSPFLKTQNVDVASDGTWSATFDMSAVAVGQEFSAELRRGTTNLASPGGVVVSELEDPDATPTPRVVTVVQPSPTPRVVEETVVRERTVERTVIQTRIVTQSPGQPGFGIAVAIVALLAAGLLALRRRD
ncbi:MAG: PGF-CTERM sorting domain-containing protein, partial [Halobacteriales archaeon]|nr:PGF-CTERM sorting domain-containing protein [Halobacteriales archaeon]